MGKQDVQERCKVEGKFGEAKLLTAVSFRDEARADALALCLVSQPGYRRLRKRERSHIIATTLKKGDM